ncbi:MAG: radical SAM protein [Candidatus Thermoplasmatota archaeon]
MKYKQINVKSAINRITSSDFLFEGRYTIDPYQRCEFQCSYCDSSDNTILIKNNIQQILEEELREIEKAPVILGSVHDPYQKAEKKYNKTREVLKRLKKHDFPVHILTKSTLILKDLDLLTSLHSCRVTISIVSLKEKVTNCFEKKLPSSQNRLNTVQKLSENNVEAGVAIMPIFPYIVEDELNQVVKQAKKHKAAYLLYKHLELKGDQKDSFYQSLKQCFPSLIQKYRQLYCDSYQPNKEYIDSLNQKVKKICKKHGF